MKKDVKRVKKFPIFLSNRFKTVLTVREEDLLACSMLGQLAWLAAILEEMPAAGCTSATPAAILGSEAGEFSLPHCRAAT